MVSSVVGFLFVCLLAWKFSCTISLHQNMFPFPIPTTLKHCSPTGTLFPQPRRYISHSLIPFLVLYNMRFKILVLLFFSLRRGPLECLYSFCPPLSQAFISIPLSAWPFCFWWPHRAFSQPGVSQPVPIQCVCDCVRGMWMKCHGFEVFSSSACIACLFHSVNTHIANKDLLGTAILRQWWENNVSSPWNQRISGLSSDHKKQFLGIF